MNQVGSPQEKEYVQLVSKGYNILGNLIVGFIFSKCHLLKNMYFVHTELWKDRNIRILVQGLDVYKIYFYGYQKYHIKVLNVLDKF